jgi:FkbM family methyltransferase
MFHPYRWAKRAIAPLGLRVPTGFKRYTNALLGRVPILVVGGPNRGLWWSLASSGSGYGTGARESRQLHVLGMLIRPGERVWDVGAHYGYLTLCAARAAGPDGSVDAFEPARTSRTFLDRHVRWNRCTTVRVHECAVGGADGTSRFGGGWSSKRHHLGEGDEIVEVRTIPTLVAAGRCAAPTFLKIDVEGAEADLLEHGLAHITSGARILVAVHDGEQYERCRSALERAGYRTYESRRLRKRKECGWRSDADLVAIGPSDPDAERVLGELTAFDY